MLRFKSLGSGSTDNATVVEAGGARPLRLLVDCGLGIRVLAQRLAWADPTLEDLDAVFITHEHGDHIGCALKLAERQQLPIWMSEGTWQGCGAPDLGDLLHLTAHDEVIDLGVLELRPFAVPHDAREPLQLVCSDGAAVLGIATDLGHAPQDVVDRLVPCSSLLLECNHDVDMLRDSSYPHFLKRRVGGDFGHLSNLQSAEIAQHTGPGLKCVLAAHLSQKNNQPELAEAALRQVLGDRVDIAVAHAVTGSDWIGA